MSLPLLVTRINTYVNRSSSKCQHQWSCDKPYSPGYNHWCPMLQFWSKHLSIEHVHIFKHYNEITWFLFSIGTYCISSMDEQRSRLTDLSSLITYHYSSLAGITKIQRIIPVVQPLPNIRSHSVLLPKDHSYTVCYMLCITHTTLSDYFWCSHILSLHWCKYL